MGPRGAAAVTNVEQFESEEIHAVTNVEVKSLSRTIIKAASEAQKRMMETSTNGAKRGSCCNIVTNKY